MSETNLISGRDLKKVYRLGDREVSALNGVSFDVKAKEFMAFVGSSGSGKTTLLNLIGCLDHPSSGQLKINGKETASLTDIESAHFRATNLGFVFQTFNLLPVLSAVENVEYPMLKLGLSAEERRERAMEWLKRVRLADQAHHRPDQLSGGQRQRVAIARALAIKPILVIADEPTANLDKKTAIEILDFMRELNVETGTTFVFSTHDPLIISRASRTVELSDGKIIA